MNKRIYAATALAGLIVGGAVSLASAASDEAAPTTATDVQSASEGGPDRLPPPETPYEVNENGLTIGPYVQGVQPPDLFEASTDEGKVGYIYVRDAKGETSPRTPEEAVEITKRQFNEKGEFVLPVYKRDGKTRIGQFVAGQIVADPDRSE